MKRYIALFFMVVAFSVTANAQEQHKEIAHKVQNDIKVLTGYITLTDAQKTEVGKILVTKYNHLSTSLSEERRKKLVQITESGLRASLNTDQNKKLDANPDLVKRLTQ